MNPRTPSLRSDLRTLANWCLLRSLGEHDDATTLTLLARKVEGMRRRRYDAVRREA